MMAGWVIGLAGILASFLFKVIGHAILSFFLIHEREILRIASDLKSSLFP